MSQQPEALKHAEWLERSLTIGAPEAAAELRRLHAVELEAIALRAQVERLQAAGQAAPAMVRLSEAAVSELSVTMVKGHKSVEWLCGKLIAEFCRINGLTVGDGGQG